jgi:hypothetical protein
VPHAVRLIADVLRAGLVVVGVVVSFVGIGPEGVAIHEHVVTVVSHDLDFTGFLFSIALIVTGGHVAETQVLMVVCAIHVPAIPIRATLSVIIVGIVVIVRVVPHVIPSVEELAILIVEVIIE